MRYILTLLVLLSGLVTQGQDLISYDSITRPPIDRIRVFSDGAGRLWKIPPSGPKEALPRGTDITNGGGGGTTLTLTQMRALTIAPTGPISTTSNGGGIWQYDITDVQSADNTGTVLVTAGGHRLKRQYSGAVYSDWFGYDKTGATDVSAVVQTMLNIGGTIHLSGKPRINSTVNFAVNNTTITGSATVVVGTGVQWVFAAVGKSNVEVNGLRAIRAPGNTGDPIFFMAQQSTQVRYLWNVTDGVLGLNTYRPAYSATTSASLCYDVTANYNTITNVGGGPWGGGITLQYVDGAKAIGNVMDGSAHAIMWWGGDGNPANGENNVAGTFTKWAKNITINNNRITNVAGGGIWGSMGENVTASNNLVSKCGDVGLDAEATDYAVFTANVVTDCLNSALATFYGSRDIDFIGTEINQSATSGNGYHAYGTITSYRVRILGGSMITRNPNRDKGAIYTDGAMVYDLTIGGGIYIKSEYRPITCQNCDGATFSAPMTLDSPLLNMPSTPGDPGSEPYSVYMQGGRNISITGLTFVYSGTAAAGAVHLGDAGAGNLIDAVVRNIRALTLPLGIKINQFGGGYNAFIYNNQVQLINSVAGGATAEGNKNAAGVAVDAYEAKFVKSLSAISGGDGNNYAAFLTVPVSTGGTYDYADVKVMMGTWESQNNKVYRLKIGNRAGLTVNYSVESADGSAAGQVLGYLNADQSLTFYVNVGAFSKAAVVYNSLMQSTGVTSLAFTSTAPTNSTLVYNTANNTPTGGGTTDLSKVVQGDNSTSRTTYITNLDADRPAGFYMYNGGVSGAPASDAGVPYSYWYLTVERHQDNTLGASSFWTSQRLTNIKTGNVYTRIRDAEASTWTAWQQVHTNAWFSVASMTPAGGDLFYYTGTSWTRLAKGTAYQTLKMSSGATAPTWFDSGGGGTPTIVKGAAVGGGGSTATLAANSTDAAGSVVLLTGSSPTASAILATITFSGTLTTPRAICLTARSANAATEVAKFWVSAKSATSWTISTSTVALSGGTYTLDYTVLF